MLINRCAKTTKNITSFTKVGLYRSDLIVCVFQGKPAPVAAENKRFTSTLDVALSGPTLKDMNAQPANETTEVNTSSSTPAATTVITSQSATVPTPMPSAQSSSISDPAAASLEPASECVSEPLNHNHVVSRIVMYSFTSLVVAFLVFQVMSSLFCSILRQMKEVIFNKYCIFCSRLVLLMRVHLVPVPQSPHPIHQSQQQHHRPRRRPSKRLQRWCQWVLSAVKCSWHWLPTLITQTGLLSIFSK